MGGNLVRKKPMEGTIPMAAGGLWGRRAALYGGERKYKTKTH